MPTACAVKLTVLPGLLVTLTGCTSNAGNCAKFPVSELLLFIVNESGFVAPAALPVQPVNTQPANGVAVAVTSVLLA